jgi:hypothetical protein
VLEALLVDWPIAPGGLLAAELFIRPPVAMPLDACVEVGLDGARVDRRPLLDGRVTLWPGAEPRPLLRHRLLAPVPVGLSGTASLTASLIDCGTLTALAAASTTVDIGAGTPSAEQLRSRAGTPDDGASFERPEVKGPRRVRASGDRLRDLEPVLPPLRLGEAWPVVVLGAVDPTAWSGAEGSLDGLATTLEPALAVASWSAPASRRGEASEAVPRPRRVLPEAVETLARAGVNAALLGDPHVDDLGPEGLADTRTALAAVGVASVDAEVRALATGAGGPVVAVVDLTDGVGGAVERIAAARDAGDVVLVAASGASAAEARAWAQAGADCVWIRADHLGPVEIVDGAVVLHGVPDLVVGSAQARSTVYARLSVDARGVQRVEIALLREHRGRVVRDEEGEGRGALVALADASRALGTDVRLGRMVAAVDVRAHWPARAPRQGVALPAPIEPTGSWPPVELPDRCAPAGPMPPDAVDLGGVRVAVRLMDAGAPPDGPIRVALSWEVVSAPGAPGVEEWSAVGGGAGWRLRQAPCDGAWGFEHWQAGDRIDEVVELWPPEAGALEGDVLSVTLAVRIGSALLRPPGGERRLTIGDVLVGR